jgi:hypothetical protein
VNRLTAVLDDPNFTLVGEVGQDVRHRWQSSIYRLRFWLRRQTEALGSVHPARTAAPSQQRAAANSR